MNRFKLLPSPTLSVVIALMWLMLNNSVSTGNLLFAAALGLIVPWFTSRFREHPLRLRRPGVVLRLAAVVAWDIVMSNIVVARQILGRRDALHSQFFWLPLSITEPHGIAALAGIITLTPGTLSADLTEDRSHLLVHALHVDDEQAAIATIKSRYEAPLMEIFKRS
jgi:multicomponent K+:H+ antiporter subunit E